LATTCSACTGAQAGCTLSKHASIQEAFRTVQSQSLHIRLNLQLQWLAAALATALWHDNMHACTAAAAADTIDTVTPASQVLGARAEQQPKACKAADNTNHMLLSSPCACKVAVA
jgi:hypothetical protein